MPEFSRLEKIRRLAAFRQTDLTVVLENVHDPHNISAIIRTCDAVGIPEVYVLYSDTRLHDARLWLGKHSTAGTRKWVQVSLFRQIEDLLPLLKARYGTLLAATLSPVAQNVYDLDFTLPSALVLGNERQGLTPELISACDVQFQIPLHGMAESLNVSVAASVVLYEAFRQRSMAGHYDDQKPVDTWPLTKKQLLNHYLAIGMKKQKPPRKFYIDAKS